MEPQTSLSPHSEIITMPVTPNVSVGLATGKQLRKASWSFVWGNFRQLLSLNIIAGLGQLVVIVLSYVLAEAVKAEATPSNLYALATLVAGVSLLVSAFALSVLARATSAVGTKTVWQVVRSSMEHFWPFVLTVALTYGVIGAGYVFLLVPGIILSILLLPTLWVILEEGLYYREALSRSITLIEGRWWSVWWRFFTIALVLLLLGLLLALATMFLIPVFFIAVFAYGEWAVYGSVLVGIVFYLLASTIIGSFILRYTYELYHSLISTPAPAAKGWWRRWPLSVLMVGGVLFAFLYLLSLPHMILEDVKREELQQGGEMMTLPEFNLEDFEPSSLPTVPDVESI